MEKVVSIAIVRDVWALISLNPQSSLQDIATTLCHSKSTVRLALNFLEKAGYVEQDRAPTCQVRSRARRIIVPLVTRKIKPGVKP
jgi:DNA-binding IclR family transcriptional regulator